MVFLEKKNQSQETFVNFYIYYILSKYIYFEKDLVRKDAPKKKYSQIKKKYNFEESFFSDALAICHLLGMIEEDPLYNAIIVWQGSIRGVWSFSRITKKKKIENFLYIFEESFFSDAAAICHLLDLVEEDRFYNPIIVWQGSIRGV